MSGTAFVHCRQCGRALDSWPEIERRRCNNCGTMINYFGTNVLCWHCPSRDDNGFCDGRCWEKHEAEAALKEKP